MRTSLYNSNCVSSQKHWEFACVLALMVALVLFEMSLILLDVLCSTETRSSPSKQG